MPRKPLLDTTVLQAALEGLEQQRLETERRIATVRALLGARKPEAGSSPAGGKPKRTRSAATRKRMAAAQRKRWATLKQAKEASAPKKRWAAFRAKQATNGAKAAAKKA